MNESLKLILFFRSIFHTLTDEASSNPNADEGKREYLTEKIKYTKGLKYSLYIRSNI